MATKQIRYQVGESWKGVYNPSVEYSLAAVVQDAEGLSIYRSLKSGNVGHALNDTSWWFCIIDMSSIANLNTSITSDEAARVLAEQGRVSAEQGRSDAESLRVTAEQGRDTAEGLRVSAEQGRDTAEGLRVSAENNRERTEAARDQAETLRNQAETNRSNAEYARGQAENARQVNENNRVAAEAERVTESATAVGRANAAATELEEYNQHPPRISTTTLCWEIWSTSTHAYVDTGVDATNVPYATFDIDVTTGDLVMSYEATYAGPSYNLDQESGNLQIVI